MFKTKHLHLLFLLFTFCFRFLHAEVWVYPGITDNMKSKKYYVRIIQNDNVYESFVYKSQNTNVNNASQLTGNNHWTSFSFEGEVVIEITKLFGNPVRYCIIRPKETRIKPEVSGHVIRIKIDKPEKLFLEINEADDDPLFIFADPPETNSVSDLDTSVLFFKPGIHDIGENYVVKDKDIYIAGGAFVIGSFLLTGKNKCQISGRGIISGSEKLDIQKSFELITVLGHNKECKIDGILFTDATGYNIYSNYKTDIYNAKFMGWSEESKGIFLGDSSSVDDCFFKVNNDIITFQNSNISIFNSIIWQQANGAPFQFTQKKKGEIENITISDIDIIRIDISEDSIWTSNKTIVNCLDLANGKIENIMLRNIRVEGNVRRLLGLNTGAGGVLDGLTFQDIKIEGVLSNENFIDALSGYVTNILFENLEANYMKIQTEYDAYIEKRGNVSEIKFEWKNY